MDVLVVEDDEDLAAALALSLGSLGHRVDVRHDGAAALERLAHQPGPEVVLLDVMMPGMDGFEVCRRLRRTSEVPVIMLTARTDPIDIVAGLEAGADDYVTKPCEPRVLDARIRAVLRRSGTPPETPVVRLGDLVVDETATRATLDGRPLALTPTEWRLLVELVHNTGLVLTRPVLLDRVWGYDHTGDSRLVDAAVQRLRSKIEHDPSAPRLLLTVRGFGYRMVKP